MAHSVESVDKRRESWRLLETRLNEFSKKRLKGTQGQLQVEISELYRAACADLAMAEQYRLSPQSVDYLHGLIGRAHNAIYRSRPFQIQTWSDLIFRKAPQQIFQDRCVQICACLFFGLFAMSAYLAFDEEIFPDYAELMIGPEQMEFMTNQFSEADFHSRQGGSSLVMVGRYIQHNTGIGLECFGAGPTVIWGLWKTAFNAAFLGACFGYMARPDTPGGDQFLEFVTAHGAFELTAIALAAAAGLRIGTGWLFTGGLNRIESMRLQAIQAVPVMTASGVLFFLAAMTEGLLSPSSLPYLFKAGWGVFSSGVLMVYFVVLGYPWAERNSAT